jgi:hypothetical protein
MARPRPKNCALVFNELGAVKVMPLEIVAGNSHTCREKMTIFAVLVRSNGTWYISSAASRAEFGQTGANPGKTEPLTRLK